MKKVLIIITVIFLVQPIFGQENLNEESILKIHAAVEKEKELFKKGLSGDTYTAQYIGFMCDTFRIERTMAKTIDLDYSTHGMLNAMHVAEDSYDKLMNVYYQRLMKALKPADRQVLINAQKAWIKFRDEEQVLIIKIFDDAYTGGGTMYQLSLYSMMLERIQKRAIELFMMYDSIVMKSN